MPVRVPRLNHLRLQTDLVEISQQKRVYCSPQNARALLLKIFPLYPNIRQPQDFGVRTNGCQLSQLIAVGRLADPVQALGQLLVIRINNPVGWINDGA